MARLGTAERVEFEALRALCYAGLGSVQLRERVGRRLHNYLGLDAFCLMELEPNVVLPVHCVSDPWTAEAFQLLVERALLASPTADPARQHRSGRRTVHVDELTLDPHRDPYFQYHLLPFGLRYELMTMGHVRGRPTAFLNVTRAPERGDFEPRHVRLLDAVVPHIAAGMHAAALRETAFAGTDAHVGVIALDADGRIDVANTAAEAWLRQNGRESRGWSLALGALAALTSAWLEGDAAHQLPVMETRNYETGALHRLSAERTLDSAGRGRTLLLIEPIRTADRPNVLLHFGLTIREAHVAVGLLQGASTEEVARVLGCAPATVRVHLRNVFDKLGVSSRRALAALLAGGPVPRV